MATTENEGNEETGVRPPVTEPAAWYASEFIHSLGHNWSTNKFYTSCYFGSRDENRLWLRKMKLSNDSRGDKTKTRAVQQILNELVHILLTKSTRTIGTNIRLKNPAKPLRHSMTDTISPSIQFSEDTWEAKTNLYRINPFQKTGITSYATFMEFWNIYFLMNKAEGIKRLLSSERDVYDVSTYGKIGYGTKKQCNTRGYLWQYWI